MRARLLAVAALTLSLSGVVHAESKKKKDQLDLPPPPPPTLPLPGASSQAAPLPLPDALPLPPQPQLAPPKAPKTPGTFQLGVYQLSPLGRAEDATSRAIDQAFLETAQASKRYRNVVKLKQPPKMCDLQDDNCFALMGHFAQLDEVLVGEVLRVRNGAAVKVRLVDVEKAKVVAAKDYTVASEDPAEIKAWAEALACDLLNRGTCTGKAAVDVDLPEMRLLVDDQPAPRSGHTPEVLSLPLGVHKVRVMVDQRTSLERKLLVSREMPAAPALYARQQEGGGISLTPLQDLQLGVNGRPDVAPSSRVVKGSGKWTRPVGITVAGVGALVAGVGAIQGLHSKSLVNDFNSKYQANHGAYLQGDLGTLSSAHSAATTANVLYATGALLAAVGLTMTFAF